MLKKKYKMKMNSAQLDTLQHKQKTLWDRISLQFYRKNR